MLSELNHFSDNPAISNQPIDLPRLVQLLFQWLSNRHDNLKQDVRVNILLNIFLSRIPSYRPDSRSNVETRESRWNRGDSSFCSVALIRSANFQEVCLCLSNGPLNFSKIALRILRAGGKAHDRQNSPLDYEDVADFFTLLSGNRNGPLHHCYARKISVV